MNLTWDTLLRVAVAFTALLIWSRIIGKKLISHMTFFDFVAGVTFGAIGGNLIFNHSVPLWIGVMGLSFFSLLALLSDYISLYSWRGRKLFEGKPILVILEGRILPKSLRQTRLTVNDLLMLLRKKDVFRLDEIQSAYFETDGSVSVLKKGEVLPVTCKDLQLHAAESGMTQACITDSHILDENLKAAGKDRQWLMKELDDQEVRLEDVLLAQLTPEGELYLSLKEKESNL
ncbi:DUF421 domain-containing protein [Gorillibacterium sp. sgz5001074]|uniref:DUF421 domain-containing protein n=1 Tax=Gorillibacterium sp. sgz5001074 TaxID=3446695 RepID=UPI003F66F116